MHSIRSTTAYPCQQRPTPVAFMEATECYWQYLASREDLLAAGVCTPAHFPEGKKRLAWSTNDAPGRSWYLRKMKGGVWSLMIYRTAEEREDFKKRERAKEAHGTQTQLTAQQWQERKLGSIDFFVDGLVNGYSKSGFRLAQRDQELIKSLARRMEMVIRAASPERNDVPAEVETPHLSPALLAPLRVVWSSSER